MMNERSLNALEYPRVLQYLAQQCVSSGARARSLELTPYTTLDEVQYHAALFDEARTWFAQAGFVLTAFPEIGTILHSCISAHALLETEALWELKQFLLAIQQVVTHLETCPMNDAPLLHTLWNEHELPRNTMLALNRCLDANGQLTDASSPELLLVRGELRRLHQNCLRKVKEYTAQYNISHYLQDEFMSLASDRYVLPLKVSYKTKLQGIIHDYSQTGETCYFEPMFLVELNNSLQSLKRDEREEERKVLQYLTDIVRADADQLAHLEEVLVQLDFLQAKARLAQSFDGHCVTIMPIESGATEELSLLGARHPLLVLGDHAVHAVDLVLRKGERALIISGGNAGGKTVCLKTLGLITVMSLAALPVPVNKGSLLPAWTQVHAFIGDEQSLDDHVSTFTAQIRSLAQAWEQCDAHSLVLLDEFGAGTDPAQGAALAQAVLDELLEKQAYVLSATHFPALKTYALSHEHVRAASVLFDPTTKKPLFTLAYDQVGASQALDVAREHGLADAVLRRAEHYLLLEGHDMTQLMDRLNALATEREKENELLRQEQEKIREKRRRMQEQLDKERGKLIADLRAQSALILARFKEGRSSPKNALREMAQLRAQVNTASAEKEKESPLLDISALQAGSRVLHTQLGKTGTVLEVDTRRNVVRVDVSGLTVWAPITILGAAGAAQPVKQVQHRPAASFLPLRLDVRGMRAELALEELGQFLDKALLSGRDGIEIIHGRGTGILRKQIHAMLRTAAHVANFYTAPEDQGGDGMTIVEFR